MIGAAISTNGSYRDAGVDIDAGNALIEVIKPLAKKTRRPGADAELGGFGALFDLKATKYKDPILVASTDGVGTKVKLAIDADRHNGIGIDLVAMCVNDLVVQGAEPLFFLDYFATGRLQVPKASDIVAGIALGCELAGCALIGGETAEMPGLYTRQDYDLAGFAVGAVEREKLITGAKVVAGDIVLGLPSSGVHANGFSLVRKILADGEFHLERPAPFATDISLVDALLQPTTIYVRSCLDAIETSFVKALAHITGGGLIENIPRVLPRGLGVALNAASWQRPKVFDWLQSEGNISNLEMARTFNCGIGMVVIVSEEHVTDLEAIFARHRLKALPIGKVVSTADASARVQIDNMAAAWSA